MEVRSVNLAQPARRRLDAWNWRHWLFYVGVPLIVAIYAASNNWALLQLAGYSGSLLFYLGHAFIPWWTTCACTWLVMRVLRPWRPRQIPVLLLGAILAGFLVLPYAGWLTDIVVAGWLSGDTSGLADSAYINDPIRFGMYLLRASAIWVAVNLLFDRLLGLPRYRDDAGPMPRRELRDAGVSEVEAADAADAGVEARSRPRFLQRLPADVAAADVIAIKAEQHYVKVFTPDRRFMTLYRFSDAVAEMDRECGQQVHRSYWVRSTAIRAIRRTSRKYFIELVNDLEVPVSAPNRGLVRQLAQQRDIPIYPPF